MPLWMVCIIALVCALLLGYYLPAPANWIVAAAIIVIVLVVAFRESKPGRGL